MKQDLREQVGKGHGDFSIPIFSAVFNQLFYLLGGEGKNCSYKYILWEKV